MTIEYTGCRKAACYLDKNGNVVSEENEYEDGTGRFVINEADQSITWTDDAEDAGKDLVFTFSFDYENAGFTEEIRGRGRGIKRTGSIHRYEVGIRKYDLSVTTAQ